MAKANYNISWVSNHVGGETLLINNKIFAAWMPSTEPNKIIGVMFTPLDTESFVKHDEDVFTPEGVDLLKTKYNEAVCLIFGKENYREYIKKLTSFKRKKQQPSDVEGLFSYDLEKKNKVDETKELITTDLHKALESFKKRQPSISETWSSLMNEFDEGDDGEIGVSF